MSLVKMSQNEVRPYLDDLQKKVEARWDATVEKTRFMQELDAGTLPMETIRVFYSNWGAFVPVINSVYMVQFYKHLYFFVSNVDLMETYTEKVLDEFGHPAPPGHIKILISSGEALGLTQEQILTQPMMPEARALTDFHRTLVNDGPMHEYWASVLWEGAFGNTCHRWFKALTTHYKLTAPAGGLFPQASRGGHHGPPWARGAFVGHQERAEPHPGAGRHRAAGLSVRVLRDDAGRSLLPDAQRHLRQDPLSATRREGGSVVARSYRNLSEYVAALEAADKLVRVTAPINKDTELHPLVRLQFRGLPEAKRKAFLFENVIDANGKHYDIPVLVAAMAGSADIYALGMGCAVEDIPERWARGHEASGRCRSPSRAARARRW